MENVMQNKCLGSPIDDGICPAWTSPVADDKLAAALPKISLLIPAYNQEAWIEACVRSALAQTYPNLEVIVSDNASTDGTERVVRGMLPDPRLVYSRNTVNVGRVRNYQRLLHELATGEFAMVIDGDDMLTNPGYVAGAARPLIEDPDVVLAFGKILQGETPKTASERNVGLGPARIIDGNTFFLDNPPFNRVGLYHLATLYRRREAIALAVYSRDVLSVDYEAFYRMIVGRKLAFTDEIAGFWRQHGNNTSHRYDIDALCRNFDALVAASEHAKASEIAEPEALSRWLRPTRPSLMPLVRRSNSTSARTSG